MEKFDLEGINFKRLVKNRTIDTFSALMWYLAGSNFGRFVRNKTNENFVLQKQHKTTTFIKDIHASACTYAPLGMTSCENRTIDKFKH